MKRIFTLLIFLSQFSMYGHAQKGTVFKIKFRPKHTYIQHIEQKNHSEIKYSGDEDFMSKLKIKGVKNPEISDHSQEIDTKMETGELVNDSNFKIRLEFVKTADHEGNPIVPDGTELFGHCNLNRMPHIDSVSIDGTVKDNKKTIPEIFESTLVRINFPEKKLAVGDIFYTTLPLTFPGKDNEQVGVTIRTGYKLLKIEKGIAEFEIRQIYKMNLGKPKFPASISGQANGILLYNLKEDFYTSYELHSSLMYSVKKENYQVETTTNSHITQKVTIAGK